MDFGFGQAMKVERVREDYREVMRELSEKHLKGFAEGSFFKSPMGLLALVFPGCRVNCRQGAQYVLAERGNVESQREYRKDVY